MSSGADIGEGGPNGIGDAPTNLGAWEKLQLGWLNFAEADRSKRTRIKLGPAGYNSSLAQAGIVTLPDQKVITWNYAYVVISTDNGATWTSLPTNLSRTTDPNGQNLGNGITGTSGGAWVDLTADIPAGSYLLGFRYVTDAAVVEPGFSVDAIWVAGGPIDGAEGTPTFTFTPASGDGGFRVTTGTEESF